MTSQIQMDRPCMVRINSRWLTGFIVATEGVRIVEVVSEDGRTRMTVNGDDAVILVSRAETPKYLLDITDKFTKLFTVRELRGGWLYRLFCTKCGEFLSVSTDAVFAAELAGSEQQLRELNVRVSVAATGARCGCCDIDSGNPITYDIAFAKLPKTCATL